MGYDSLTFSRLSFPELFVVLYVWFGIDLYITQEIFIRVLKCRQKVSTCV